MLLTPPPAEIVERALAWVDGVVIEHNLCPFAAPVRRSDQLGAVVTDATTAEGVLEDLHSLLVRWVRRGQPPSETLLFICPAAFVSFLDFNDFQSVVEALLEAESLEGVVQVPFFHPDFTFAGEDEGDISHYTNRAPYPILHLLKEADVSRAVDSHPDAEGIPERNIAHLQALGDDAREAILSLSRKGPDLGA